MKFYSWNTGRGGTCPDYAVVCQFRTKEGKLVTEDFCVKEDMPAWVSAVHSIKKDDGSTYYITTRSHRASSNDGYRWMDAFIIDHDTLKNVSVYDAGDDLDECGLEINYSISDWYYATNGEGWDWLFEYDAQNRNLYIPKSCMLMKQFPSSATDIESIISMERNLLNKEHLPIRDYTSLLPTITDLPAISEQRPILCVLTGWTIKVLFDMHRGTPLWICQDSQTL